MTTNAAGVVDEDRSMAARAFYAEFDDVKGPCVCYDEPRGCLTGDPDGRRIWETYSDYVITGQGELDGVVVQVRAGRDGVVCVPVVCQDEQKYARNALLFSLGVAVSSQGRKRVIQRRFNVGVLETIP